MCNASFPPPSLRRDTRLGLPPFAQMLIFVRPEVSSVCLYHPPKCPIKLKWWDRLKFIAMTNNYCDHKASSLQGNKDRSPASATSQSSYKCAQFCAPCRFVSKPVPCSTISALPPDLISGSAQLCSSSSGNFLYALLRERWGNAQGFLVST